ncbi:MBL fold metallo-hydrolase [Thalassovita sp.]|uniref:MBL fold metallo-hydrolase n=1 Tax=Thalassovita sp. TaxID=1979401 RepID=UPI002AAF825F|nr:MBL fold metallo-hydrolase [Thalassovita sp.]
MSARIHDMKIGEIDLRIFDDGRFTLPAAYFGNVPEGMVLGEQVEIGANLWLIRSGDRVILVDTGSAEALKAMFPETGAAWGDLQGVQPTDIVLTHMHADHLGGFADPAAFAGVTIHVAAAEWGFWTNPDLPGLVPEENRPMIEMIQGVAAGIADRVVTHDGAAELAPGVTLAPLPGHTPGHTGVQLQSGGQELLIVSDAVITEQIQMAQPEVTYALDGDAAAAVATRQALLAEAAAKGTPIAATHFAFPGVGTVVAEGRAYRFQPV